MSVSRLIDRFRYLKAGLVTVLLFVGWRGHGSFRRLLMGSVSRDVVERARSAVLVVRPAVREVRRIVIGVDGSPNAHRAVRLAARLSGEGLEIVVVRVVEPIIVPTGGLLPASVRATVRHQAALMNKQRLRRARRDGISAAAALRRAGWAVRAEVRTEAPLAGLRDVVDRTDADLLVVGARARSGIERAVLGSVAAGALNRARAPVLVVP
jgi:nucleotide-binding universal stress UspA family protein